MSVLAAGCGSDEADNAPHPTVALRVAAVSTDSDSVAVSSSGTAISVERALVALEILTLVPCGDYDRRGFEPVNVDLTARPPLELDAPGTAPTYCGGYVAPYAGETPTLAELEGRSVLIEGTRADGTPFRIASAETPLVTLFPETAGTPFSAHGLLLGFDLATWLGAVDLDAAAVEDGQITLDASHNTDELAAFEARTASATAFYADTDGDGALTRDDQAPVAFGH